MVLLQVILALAVSPAFCKEVGVPERFLRPRNFNPHPYGPTTASPLDLQEIFYEPTFEERQPVYPDLPQEHPYRFFVRPNVRGEDDRAPVQFPKVPPSTGIVDRSRESQRPPISQQPFHYQQRQQQQIQQLQHEILQQARIQAPLRLIKKPQLQTRGKSYAFSYSVKDGRSGDDYSHAQAQRGDATRGEYRVKLPDGRLQVVTYTADDRGYRADVRYDNGLEDFGNGPTTPIEAVTPVHEVFNEGSTPGYDPVVTPTPPTRQQPLVRAFYPRPNYIDGANDVDQSDEGLYIATATTPSPIHNFILLRGR